MLFGQLDLIHLQILIAADGSRSKINDLIGLDNRNHTLGYAVIQNRGPVTPEIEALLPQMLCVRFPLSHFVNLPLASAKKKEQCCGSQMIYLASQVFILPMTRIQKAARQSFSCSGQ